MTRLPSMSVALAVVLALVVAAPFDSQAARGSGSSAGSGRSTTTTSHRPRSKRPSQPMSKAQAAKLLRQLPAGESNMPKAPTVRINDKNVVPSQYKLFRHTGETVQGIVSKIRYKSNMVLLVGGGKKSGVYIQIGILGPDNYPVGKNDQPAKIVYGRKWRVEKLLPTSELIQTVFLAIKSAEEHELREQFVVDGTTPFNNHLDLPLLATHQRGRRAPTAAAEKMLSSEKELAAIMSKVRLGGHRVKVSDMTKRASGALIYDVELIADVKVRQNPMLAGKKFTVVADAATHSGALRGLMSAALEEVNKEVDERFQFDGFARFSRSVPVSELVDFSRAHRSASNTNADPQFAATGSALNRAIDSTRPARIRRGPANDRALAAIEHANRDGALLGDRPVVVD